MISKFQILLGLVIVDIVSIVNGPIDMMKKGIVLAMRVEIFVKLYRMSLLIL
jgi:hypothetical protein